MCDVPRSQASAVAAMLQSGARAGHCLQPAGLISSEKARKPVCKLGGMKHEYKNWQLMASIHFWPAGLLPILCRQGSPICNAKRSSDKELSAALTRKVGKSNTPPVCIGLEGCQKPVRRVRLITVYSSRCCLGLCDEPLPYCLQHTISCDTRWQANDLTCSHAHMLIFNTNTQDRTTTLAHAMAESAAPPGQVCGFLGHTAPAAMPAESTQQCAAGRQRCAAGPGPTWGMRLWLRRPV